jgi:Family of unknown function (DUF6483)
MEEAERLTKLIAAVVFQKHLENEQSGVEYSISQDAMLLGDLRRMTHNGNINEAENLLFERLLADPGDHNFSVAGIFYRELSRMTDDELKHASFSREEIMEGLQSIERIAKAYKEENQLEEG